MANMPTCTAGYRNPLTDNKTSVWSLQPRAVESLSADLQWHMQWHVLNHSYGRIYILARKFRWRWALYNDFTTRAWLGRSGRTVS
jgi:hypothetical protein